MLASDGKPDRSKAPVLELEGPRAKDLISTLQAHHTILDPTVALYEIFGHTKPLNQLEPGLDHLPPQLREASDTPPAPPDKPALTDARWQALKATLRALHAAGIPIVAGTDQAIPGYSLHRELELYVEAGFTPLEALQAATIVAARALSVEKESGSLQMGKRGDVLLLDADPLADIHNTRKVWRTVAAGAVYNPAPLWHSVGFLPSGRYCCRRRTQRYNLQMIRAAHFLFPLIFLSGPAPGVAAMQAQAAPKPAPQLVTADSPFTTPAGATFIVPAGWSVAKDVSSATLQPPEPDTHIAIFDVHAADAAAAVSSAWSSYKPDMKRPLKVATTVPDREGWTGGKQFIYETSPNERAVVVAVALHAGDTWTVVLADGSEPTFEKRGAQINVVIQSLRPKGYQRESFAGRKALPLTPERIEELKTFVETSMKKLGVPGASLALIDNGKVVYEGGLGVRELGKPTPVDAKTLFMVASNTKGMTTLLLARLVDAHQLQWNQPVIQVYPAFKLGDADITRQVEVKHLVCACTGLPRQDLEWIFQFKSYTPESTFTLLSNMQPTSRFGEVFQYSNLMASAAGYIGAHLYDSSHELGAAYDNAMQKEIFDPLGMTDTTFDMERAQHGNFASPHADDVDGHPALATMDNNYSVVPFRPAGGVWSSAHDMTRYVQLELARGKLPNGEQFVSEENLLMRRKPQIPTGEDETYGMGLEINNRWGVPIIHHGGSLFGYKSDWMILPDSGIGAVLLTNADNGGMLLHPFMRRLVEVVFDGKPEAVGDVDSATANHRAYMAKERQRLTVPASSDEVSKLAEHYTSTALGDLAVEHQGANTLFDFSGWKSTIASRKNDDGTVSFITIDPSRMGFEFVKAERNGNRALIIRDGQHEYVFAAMSAEKTSADSLRSK